MPLKLAPFLILILGAAVIGYGLWQRQLNPPIVRAAGTFQFTDTSGTILIFPKRTVAVGGFETTEIQLPGGTWIDCRRDCAETVRTEHTDFWDTRMLNKR
jgi:hypothetical protein